jgi:hypothetical protein
MRSRAFCAEPSGDARPRHCRNTPQQESWSRVLPTRRWPTSAWSPEWHSAGPGNRRSHRRDRITRGGEGPPARSRVLRTSPDVTAVRSAPALMEPPWQLMSLSLSGPSKLDESSTGSSTTSGLTLATRPISDLPTGPVLSPAQQNRPTEAVRRRSPLRRSAARPRARSGDWAIPARQWTVADSVARRSRPVTGLTRRQAITLLETVGRWPRAIGEGTVRALRDRGLLLTQRVEDPEIVALSCLASARDDSGRRLTGERCAWLDLDTRRTRSLAEQAACSTPTAPSPTRSGDMSSPSPTPMRTTTPRTSPT